MTPVAEPVPHMTPEQPEQPKRRSTVREPAPTFTSGQGFTPPPRSEPSPTREPSAPEESSGDDNKPRKSGWWSRKVFGDKG
jgi:ribonuclease E